MGIQRYSVGAIGILFADEGPWVKLSDHEAEVDRQKVEIAELRKEIERLKAANVCPYCHDIDLLLASRKEHQ